MSKSISSFSGYEKAKSFLQTLNSKIRKFCPSGKWGNEIGHYSLLRDLTMNEWQTVQKVIKEHEFSCLLRPTAYDFDLVIHDRGDLANVLPDHLLTITCYQLPEGVRKKMSQEEILSKVIFPLTHCKRNKELLSWYGFEPLQDDPQHYAY